MRGLPLILTLATAATPALAQPTVREVRVDGFTLLTDLNAESCSDDTARALLIDVTGLERSTYTLRFIRYPDSGPHAPCPTDMLDPEIVEVQPDEEIEAVSGRFNATYSVTNADLVGEDCTSAEGGRGDIHFCFQLTELPDDVTAVLAGGVEVLYDTSIPPIPKIVDVSTGDTSVTVEVEEVDTGGDSYTTIVQYRECGDDDEADAGTPADAGPEIESECGASGAFKEADADGFIVVVGSLKTGSRIELRALFEDDFENRGEATSLRIASPEATLGPLSLYDGTENPASCDASCTDYSGSAALVFLLALSRRGRRALTRARKLVRASSLMMLLPLLVGLAWSPAARAEFGQMTVGFAVSPYKPAIDTELAKGSQQRIFPIYDCFFDGATLLEIGGDIDTHLWDGFGSLQLTTGLSLAQARGFAQPSNALSTQSCQKATEIEVQLTFMKVRPGLTYRFDPLLDWIGVPLVPYGRLGLVAAAYGFTKDGDFDKGGMNPLGVRFGWEGALGLMLALDFLDSIDPFVPDTTRRARANGVFDHTFLFVEGAYQDVTTFGQDGLVLTPVDELIGTGWPVLWKIGVAVELL